MTNIQTINKNTDFLLWYLYASEYLPDEGCVRPVIIVSVAPVLTGHGSWHVPVKSHAFEITSNIVPEGHDIWVHVVPCKHMRYVVQFVGSPTISPVLQ